MQQFSLERITALRFAARTPTGGLLYASATGGICLSNAISLTWSDDIETGTETVKRDGNDKVCRVKKVEPFVKRATGTLTGCKFSPEVLDFLEVGSAISVGGSVRGYKHFGGANCEQPRKRGVYMEAYGEAYDCDEFVGLAVVWFPLARNWAFGERTLSAEPADATWTFDADAGLLGPRGAQTLIGPFGNIPQEFELAPNTASYPWAMDILPPSTIVPACPATQFIPTVAAA
jgi:hypothetical protein